MTDETQFAGYAEYIPTRRERLWRALGFRYHHGDSAPEVWEASGWFQNKSCFHFDWKDRLRLLFTGRLKVVTTYDLDTVSPDKIRTRLDWQILAPGELR